MSKPTEIIYIGNCKNLIEDLNKSTNVLIKRNDIKVKKGTMPFIFPIQEQLYYPISFECKDEIDQPKGKYIAGEFINYINKEFYGYIKKSTIV